MDKYTVDLDKVLNDFEYSELTEQSNGFSNNYSQNQPQYSLNQKSSYSDSSQTFEHQTYPKAPITTAKHSINNVFHSLNEYLNTDIKTDISNASSSLSEINEIDTSLPTLIRKNSKDKTDISSIEEIFKSISKEENEEINVVNKNINTYSVESDKSEINKVILSDEPVNNNLESKINLNLEDENILVQDDETLVDLNVQVEENIDNIPEEIDQNVKESTIVSLNDDNIEVTIIQPEPIKFQDIEVSDTEVENELEELEQEYQDKCDNNKINEEIDEEEIVQKDLKSELEEIVSKSNSVINETDVVNKTSECINYLETNEAPESELDDNKTQISETVEDKCELESKEPNEEDDELKEKGINNKEISEEQRNLEKSQEEDDNNKVIEEEETKTEEKEEEVKVERRGSIRPSSLDLNSESTSENVTINLIGEPGSTPYNNLYASTLPIVSSTEPKHTLPSEVEAEPDTGNSLSPTLSDASTYDNSNSDSPNTSDSCNDTSLDEHSNENTPPGHRRSGERKSEGSIGERPMSGEGEGGQNSEMSSNDVSWLGKTAPFWTPDSDALCCLHCNQKFTVIKRRHHCRACGLVLCSKCCNMKSRLQYMDNAEARVCLKCYDILTKAQAGSAGANESNAAAISESATTGPGAGPKHSLRPGNPMDYCSTVPPHQQVSATAAPPPTVLVPVGVLKRQGSGKSRSSKSVMFCDGIRPGCDLTELDRDFNYKSPDTSTTTSTSCSGGSSSGGSNSTSTSPTSKKSTGQSGGVTGRANRNLPRVDSVTGSYIPKETGQLPPVVNVMKSDVFYADCSNNNSIVDMLKNETITFAIQRNFHIHVRVINMDCCINKQAWCFSTEGMIAVGQDEIIILLEFIDNEKFVPKDVFLHLNNIYNDAVKGTSIAEMGISIHPTSNFLESKNHAGFLYIKPTFQCIQNVIIPKEPYLIGILIHRWETPWAKIFPLRLLLRLGAEYRYYPSPIISTRHRESVYVEIGHTIINLLADFRNFSYTIPSVRGLTIHMEDKNTTVSIPGNRYDQVVKALNNSSDHILAFAANFSSTADSHLVCIQDTHGNNENAYTTHAINIHNKPRKVTGASFIVLNGALKSSSGLTAKSSIVEDGLMIQIPADHMQKLRTALRNMKDFRILCGPINATSDESVSLVWVENDSNFNVGVISPIDNMSLSGIPSIRVHNGRDFVCNSGNKMIRWTEVFIIQSGEECTRTQDPVDVSKLSESISKATSQALVKYLDLLATNSCTKIAIRTILSIENVSYLAGSNGTKLPPIYMKSLDNELIPVLHRITAGFADNVTVSLELMFHILNF